MKTHNFFTIFLLIFCINTINAQEVFFKENTTKLKPLLPEHYYTFISNKTPLKDVRTNDPHFDLPPKTLYHVSGRFFTDLQFLTKSASRLLNADEAIDIPQSVFSSFANKNTSRGLSFWVRYNKDVFDGLKDGMLFTVLSEDNSRKIVAKIVKKKITIYATRPKIAGGNVLVPIVVMDFPIEWDPTLGSPNSNYFFFCITSITTDTEKKTKIYMSRPDGKLLCRSYYIDIFESLDKNSDKMELFGRATDFAEVQPAGINDVMFYPSKNTLPTTDEILSNFYLQSPLYEGVSYKIASNIQGNVGFWGLESENSRYSSSMEQYITIGNNGGNGAFGYNRFMLHGSPYTFLGQQFENMLEGGAFARSYNDYIYTGRSSTEKYLYLRNLDDPSSMYQLISTQFILKRIGTDGYLQSYRKDDKEWLVFDSPPAEKDRALFGITAAFKFARGAEREYSGPVNLVSKAFGKFIKWGPNFDTPIGFNQQYIEFTQRALKLGIYKNIAYSPRLGSELYNITRPEDRCEMVGEYPLLYFTSSSTGKCYFDLLYSKDDENGKPLYLLRNVSNNRSAFPKVISRMSYDPSRTEYVTGDVVGPSSNGDAGNTLLWTIRTQ